MKGCARTYKLLMNSDHNIILDIQEKWEETLMEEIPYDMVRKAFVNLHKMKEGAFTKYVQFKMLHKRIVTNKLLYDMGIVDASTCPYCDEPEETIEHAFLKCNGVKEFWNELERWLKLHIDNSLKILNIEKIMSTGTLDNIVDKSIVAAKRVIYKNRQVGKRYSLNEMKALLKTQMRLEEYHSSIEGTDLKFLQT